MCVLILHVRPRQGSRCHRKREDSEDMLRAGMDYVLRTERGVMPRHDEAEAVRGECMALLVTKDLLNKSVLACLAASKVMLKVDWLTAEIQADPATTGVDNCMLVAKTDQEPATV